MRFKYEDVGFVIDLLKSMEPREALSLSEDLCIYSQNILNRDSGRLLVLNPKEG
jgi:hypothetical protein